MTRIEKLAEKYAIKYHEGQFRKKSRAPYVVHPKHVVELLKQYDVKDQETLAIAWLHDTLEDTVLSYSQIKNTFGSRVADGVHFLTRDVNEIVYKQRLLTAPEDIQLVKLCDTIDNIKNLEVYSPRGLQRKIVDCNSFYIPLAEKIKPEIADKMKFYLDNYEKSKH
ncbi:MAG: HD domain-containing protein [Nanoarchaeota archaeon]|nr:HD domain-containing protein [Nanoarchaeota archaeon]MBU1321246.1 HD domain-containing protein [Nanoarchaeota archaeon]MBU1597000.1 HD domain-containing protein [Nanoarchaeota archaeon]MBU2441579.1 HD domain-containing protein [Nanoarchaeota archaeon]